MAIRKGTLVRFTHRESAQFWGIGICVSDPWLKESISWSEFYKQPPGERKRPLSVYSRKTGTTYNGSRYMVKVYWQKFERTIEEPLIFLMRVTKKGQESERRIAERNLERLARRSNRGDNRSGP